MPDKDTAAEFRRRAAKVRELAKGIYDQTDRRFILKFVADCEKLVAESAPKMRT